MKRAWPDYFAAIVQLLKWTLLVLPVGILAGSASALFLWSLDRVTELRWQNGWLLFLLPVAGLAVGWLYDRIGRSAEGGNNLILDQIHAPGGGVPRRMAPLILVSTLVTHLFGGSAGREGTAVQMGGSLASAYGRLFKFGPENVRVLLMAGVAAGFGSVFGTPLAGAIFAMEVLVIGRMHYDALIPVLVASIVGDMTCSAWGVQHTTYQIAITERAAALFHWDPLLLGKVTAAAVLFGLVSWFFAEFTHALQRGLKKLVPALPLRAALGGVLVIALVYGVGTRDYLGLGVHAPDSTSVTLLSAFHPGGAAPWSWWWKIIFTAVTLAAGFKGGEVTPLFFIGATLGNTLGSFAGAPVDLFAGLGFIAVFAGATNTPLACTVMGIELFGAHYGVYFAVACFIAYFASGHSGIYAAQRLGRGKRGGATLPPDASLQEVRGLRALTGDSTVGRLTEFLAPTTAPSVPTMKDHHIISREMGKIRIYLSPDDRLPAAGLWDKLAARPVYREIIHAAKRDGLRNAGAYLTHFGFTNNPTQAAAGSAPRDPSVALCVELIDHKDALEAFCRRHGALLQGRTIVYKHVEHWDVQGGRLVEADASPDEVIDGSAKKPAHLDPP